MHTDEEASVTAIQQDPVGGRWGRPGSGTVMNKYARRPAATGLQLTQVYGQSLDNARSSGAMCSLAIESGQTGVAGGDTWLPLPPRMTHAGQVGR